MLSPDSFTNGTCTYHLFSFSTYKYRSNSTQLLSINLYFRSCRTEGETVMLSRSRSWDDEIWWSSSSSSSLEVPGASETGFVRGLEFIGVRFPRLIIPPRVSRPRPTLTPRMGCKENSQQWNIYFRAPQKQRSINLPIGDGNFVRSRFLYWIDKKNVHVY